MKTHYSVLDVAPDADQKTIQAAYYKAARKWHPDSHARKSKADSDKAEAEMRRINEAWSVLGEKAKRATYDQGLRDRPETARRAFTTTEGVTRVDSRLLNRDYLQKRRVSQQEEISSSHSLVLRAAPLVALVGALLLVFVFSAYAGGNSDSVPVDSPDGPALGAGLEVDVCVVETDPRGLQPVPCLTTADKRIVGSRWVESGSCPAGTTEEFRYSGQKIACLGPLIEG